MSAQPQLVGCDELRAWLQAQGFRVWRNYMSTQHNACNWYAAKRSAIPARECECNEDKPAQIVVYPHDFEIHGRRHQSNEVEITGEAADTWFNLKAYGIKDDELKARLPEIEAMLVSAWNALLPPPAP